MNQLARVGSPQFPALGIADYEMALGCGKGWRMDSDLRISQYRIPFQIGNDR
jgi:hypothetical protein